jgi:pimeloyl-ACP methyl ester carboxylesterase
MDMVGFVPGLIESGCSVLIPDLPAHGDSGGTRCSIPIAMQALLDIAAEIGNSFEAVVAHSVGCAAAVEAMNRGLGARRVVLIAPPARYKDYAVAFATARGFDVAATEDMLAELRRRGVDANAWSVPRAVERLSVPALILHSRDDRVVPFQCGAEVAAACSRSVFVPLEGLGHKRMLIAPEVIRDVVEFAVGRAIHATTSVAARAEADPRSVSSLSHKVDSNDFEQRQRCQ